MTTPTAPMTKLDAVNDMLASIGQSPLNTLVGTIPKDGAKAVLALDHALREVLSKGWSFNSDREYPLTPDGNGRIAVPAAAASIDPTFREPFTMRWDSAEGGAMRPHHHTKRTVTDCTDPIKCDVIWLFEFEQVPQHARQYIAMKAGRKFQVGIIGSRLLYQFTRDMEDEAWSGFRRIEKRNQDYNINHNSGAVHRRRNVPR